MTGGHRKPFDHDSKRSFSLQSYSWTLHQGPHTVSKSVSSRLKDVLLQSVVQKLDREVGLRVTAKRLPKSAKELKVGIEISVDGSRR